MEKARKSKLPNRLADARLQKKHGVWVYHSGEPLSAATVEETMERIRLDREDHNLGKIR